MPGECVKRRKSDFQALPSHGLRSVGCDKAEQLVPALPCRVCYLRYVTHSLRVPVSTSLKWDAYFIPLLSGLDDEMRRTRYTAWPVEKDYKC